MESISVKKRNGKLEEFDVEKINKCVYRACQGIDGNNVSASEVILDAQLQLYDKITTKEIDEALILSARAKIEKEPNYSKVASALAVNALYKEVFRESVDSDTFELQYRKTFVQNTKKLVKAGVLSDRLLDFDLKKISEAIMPERDKIFKYLGLQILIDRYFLKLNKKTMETPQAFWLRIAMGLALNEENKEERAIEFYNLFSNMLYKESGKKHVRVNTLEVLALMLLILGLLALLSKAQTGFLEELSHGSKSSTTHLSR